MTASRKLDPREIVRGLLESEVALSERAAALLVRLENDGAPAGTRPDHPQLAAALGSLYRSSVLISWPSRDTLGQRLRWGQAEAGKPERTPEQVRQARKRAVTRAEKELLERGLLIVLKKAAPSHRADKRSNLYALDLEACLRLTRGHQRPLVEPEQDTYEGSPVTPRNDLRGVTRVTYEGSPVTPKDKEEDKSLSKDQKSGQLVPSEPASSEEREELRSALRSASTSRAAPAEEEQLLSELLDLEATPEQVEASRPILKAKGWQHLPPRQIVQEWPYVLEQLAAKGSQPVIAGKPRAGLCICGGSLWLSSPTGQVQCWKTHDESGQPDRDRWLELELTTD